MLKDLIDRIFREAAAFLPGKKNLPSQRPCEHHSVRRL